MLAYEAGKVPLCEPFSDNVQYAPGHSIEILHLARLNSFRELCIVQRDDGFLKWVEVLNAIKTLGIDLVFLLV